jgi:hypothetical protein
VNRFSVLLLIAGLLQTSALLAASRNVGVITFAEKPLRLIRATALYNVGPGVHLQNGDFIESDQSITQIEGLATSTLALGPNTRAAITQREGVTVVHILRGWLKVQPAPRTAASGLEITTRNLRSDVSRSASVMHVSDTQVEVFVESGSQSIVELDKRGQPGRTSLLSGEQFTLRKGDEPLQPPGRPPATFISTVPNAFFDALVLLSGKPAGDVAPKKIRDVDFADIAHWLHAPNLNRTHMANQFAPRLANPAFREAIVREMGGSFEWETALFRFESKSRTLKKTGDSVRTTHLQQPTGA